MDSWSPGVRRPVGKSETTWRTAAMLSILETHVREIIQRGVPFTVMSSLGLNRQQIDKLTSARGPKDIAQILLTDDIDAAKSAHRMGGGDIPQSVLYAMSHYREQLNAATGVMDSQRGQPLPGEKTALEVRTLYASQGVQARHTRKQYAKFLKSLVT